MPSFDTLIRHGRVVDGSGNPWIHADVALAGDRIAAIAPPAASTRRGRARSSTRPGTSSAPASSTSRATPSCP